MKTSNSVEPDLILASSSPRRKDLLNGLRVRFNVVPSTVEEVALNGEAPQDQVTRLALKKAEDVMLRFPGCWVLGADTLVVIDGKTLGKPRDEDEAKTMLAVLADRTHVVFTGYALIHSRFPENRRIRYVRSEVRIRELSHGEIEGYVRTAEPMDKAGAYAIQGIGSGLVESVNGSYTNVVGLPLCEVARDLKDLGIFDFLKAKKES
jgi:septum formation protein